MNTKRFYITSLLLMVGILTYRVITADNISYSWNPATTDTLTTARYVSDRNAVKNIVNGNLSNVNLKTTANIAQIKIDSSSGWITSNLSSRIKLTVDTIVINKYANIKKVVRQITSSTDSLWVNGVDIVEFTAGGGTITIGGFANGVTGQIVHCIKTNSGSTIVLEHAEATGIQKLYNADGNDDTYTVYGGSTYIYNGTNWYQISGVGF